MTDTTTTTSTTTTAVRPAWLTDAVLLAFRVVIGLFFLMHATFAFGAFGGIDGQGGAAPVGSWPMWWAGVIEVIGAVLVVIGLYARPAAFVLSGVMAFAYFTVHLPMGWNPIFNQGEPAALFSWIFLLLSVIGPGAYALDAVRRRK